ncbi:hypothetical protein ACH4PX_37390 [Streptomyces anulatus]
MSTTREPAGVEPEEQPEPEQSGTVRPIQHDRPESVGKSFFRGMAEGAGRVVGTVLASAILIGLPAGGVIAAVMQEGPHQRASCTA